MLWRTEPMVCTICPKDWVATFPVVAPKLECPDCGYMNEIPPSNRKKEAPDPADNWKNG